MLYDISPKKSVAGLGSFIGYTIGIGGISARPSVMPLISPPTEGHLGLSNSESTVDISGTTAGVGAVSGSSSTSKGAP